MSKLDSYKALTKEYLLSILRYDRDKGHLYWRPDNGLNQNKKSYDQHIGANQKQYATFKINGKIFAVHRIIHFLETGEHPTIVDHIDMNIHNNHYSNLRASDYRENRLNTKKAGYETRTNKDGSQSHYVRYYGNKLSLTVGVYKNETVAKFAAWWLRELMYPGIVECPEFSEDEQNALLRIMENYSPIRS